MAPYEFLRLPHEIRHNIYRAYFALSGGYVFQPESDKLVAANGQPLDLALMYTCRFIASETKELPLKHNVVTFSTVYRPEWRSWAARFDYLLRIQLFMQTRLLIELGGSGFITPNIYAQIDDNFPWFTSGLRYAVRNNRIQDDYDRGRYVHQVCWASEWRMLDTVTSRNAFFRGVNGSRYEISQAIKFALRLVARGLGDDSNEHLARWLEGWQGREGLLQFLDHCYEPWDMPPISELESMGKRFGDDDTWLQLQDGWENDRHATCPVGYRSKHRFSATATAIRFLSNLPTDKRSTMRELVLNEDHIAVGFQECHSHGLLALHKENPQLRVELRASLPNNLLQASNMFGDAYEFQSRAEDLGRHRTHHINAPGIFKEVSRWSTEALATVDSGMSVASYSLVFCGEPCIDLCSEIFQQVVQRDAAFFIAFEKCFPGLLHGYGSTFSFSIHPRALEALAHLVNQTSVLRANFHTGVLWDADKFVQELTGLRPDTIEGRKKVNHLLLARERPRFDLPHTMPHWFDLMMENYECGEVPLRRELYEARLAHRQALRRLMGE
ncbi:hypothetical protein H9Q69_014314 [Fusarium xylarioides]|uniref:Uncharacterized protein n=1 Tax=Fusarium xylarioides TaxID=221167 RepID=A0A9P7HDT7_9HYPO|nr:hypothetical protein H9Q70_014436 [Fusarium xylarioides]KAG5757550.1 hypothetical protein H9Q72_014308 [Fusarium xylarioides]KAG5770115.1 hypothetical protein H9Q73_013316 [Fusarium xylarioides]KAG5786606.1 hypothetical protein H9Q69_014314 [Fusarium xylarioides]KAG5801392.1 hypothetical protein H9Q71_014024 [Fusarium xylarioides]